MKPPITPGLFKRRRSSQSNGRHQRSSSLLDGTPSLSLKKAMKKTATAMKTTATPSKRQVAGKSSNSRTSNKSRSLRMAMKSAYNDMASVASGFTGGTSTTFISDDDVKLKPSPNSKKKVGMDCHCFGSTMHCGFDFGGAAEEEDSNSSKAKKQEPERESWPIRVPSEILVCCGPPAIEEQDDQPMIIKTVKFDVPEEDASAMKKAAPIRAQIAPSAKKTMKTKKIASAMTKAAPIRAHIASFSEEDDEDYLYENEESNPASLSIVPPLATYALEKEQCVEVGEKIILDQLHNELISIDISLKDTEEKDDEDNEIAIVIAAHVQATVVETEILDVCDQRLDVVYVDWLPGTVPEEDKPADGTGKE
eukprot:CAMPEP_0178666638 /NCGR_PEP_ID=MMETSP0698-20121128/30600_1 /TAXON_ID=265572 /ORGANISM="Extubocellulus spinifer, Strain CCMP396" /LENGTH=364 /DNA_ID=CAMNT_0020310045 /DNA_START=363 /DNA_END=1457 /DNA_ORIENTATION=-